MWRESKLCLGVLVLILGACALMSNLSRPAHAQTPMDAHATPTATPTPTPQQQPTAAPTDESVEHVESDLVNVLFNAVDKERRFVTTIKQEDIRVSENDAPQQIAQFERETDLPLSLAILIDVSASQEESIGDEKNAAHLFVQSIVRPGQDKAAIISFTGTATVEQELTSDRAALERAIDRVEIVPPATRDERVEYEQGERAPVVPADIEATGLPGSTAIWDAIWATSNELMPDTSQHTRRAIILLTDGDDTTSRLQRDDAVTAAVKANTIIYAIGIEPGCDDCPFDKKALRKVSEQTGGRAFFPKDLPALNAAFAQIQQELRTQYLVAYVPTNRAHDGTYRRIHIELVNPELKRQGVRLNYREGYFAKPPGAQPPPRPRLNSQRLARPPRKPRKQ